MKLKRRLKLKSYWKKHRWQRLFFMLLLYPIIIIASAFNGVWMELRDSKSYFKEVFRDFNFEDLQQNKSCIKTMEIIPKNEN